MAFVPSGAFNLCDQKDTIYRELDTALVRAARTLLKPRQKHDESWRLEWLDR